MAESSSPGQQPRPPDQLVLCFVSGKGGVGKTMLAAAAAAELSRARPTLLLDLDFFNRGLTGLLSSGEPVAEVAPPSILAPPDGTAAPWTLRRVAPNLYFVSYPDLSPQQSASLENAPLDTLTQTFGRFIDAAAGLCGASTIVLDCHGGPDNASLAACLLADRSLLVSEPDRITFYGTLHFLRRLELAADGRSYDVRLIFNRVVPAFSSGFLYRLYDSELRPAFGGRPLAALFPLEIYLAKEFEVTPLVTRVYPGSLLAKKTQLMLWNLLAKGQPSALSSEVLALPAWARLYRKLAMGRTIPILDLNAVFSVAMALGVFLAVLLFVEKAGSPQVDDLRNRLDRIDFLARASQDPALRAAVKCPELDPEPSLVLLVASVHAGDASYRGVMEKIRDLNGRVGLKDYPWDMPDKLNERRMLWLSQPASRFDGFVCKGAALIDLRAVRGTSRGALLLSATQSWPLVGFVLLFGLLVYFIVFSVLFNWSRALEKRFVYGSRRGEYFRSVMSLLGATILWVALIWVVSATVAQGWKALHLTNHTAGLFGTNFGVMDFASLAVIALVILMQLYKAYWSRRFQGQTWEPAGRVCFVLVVVANAVFAWNHRW
jgi:cellulose biosynthesis protein BcsQ